MKVLGLRSSIATVALVTASQIGAANGSGGASVYYEDKTCTKPLISFASIGGTCEANFGCAAGNNISISEFCFSDEAALLKDTFNGSPYVLAELYVDSACVTLKTVEAFLADGNCHTFSGYDGAQNSVKTITEANGTVSVVGAEGNCSTSTTTFDLLLPVPKANLNTDTCISIKVPARGDDNSSTLGAKYYVFESSTTTGDSSDASSTPIRTALMLVAASLMTLSSI